MVSLLGCEESSAKCRCCDKVVLWEVRREEVTTSCRMGSVRYLEEGRPGAWVGAMRRAAVEGQARKAVRCSIAGTD